MNSSRYENEDPLFAKENIYNWSVFQIYVELEATEQYKVQPEVLAVTLKN